ncbi:unnamed protein product [Thelazia callipaeda]|uniref:Uncharacterized protein n=1 Tax=Thelazia callipaeda TaxID=103827 RepID=A0A0N5D821_THECL|nr:unnamed protein product [Thelazia callipaeda]
MSLQSQNSHFFKESKPVLAVKGISAPKVIRLTPPSSKYTSPKTTNPKNSPVTESSTSPSKWLDFKSHSTPIATSIATDPTIATLTQCKTVNATVSSQSPTIGVVSPMMSHRVMKLPQNMNTNTDCGNQSDASTTSGSRDSDNVSVIYNPTDEDKLLATSSSSEKMTSDKKAPPVPMRTNSRLETTFASNYAVTTAEITAPIANTRTLPGVTDLQDIYPMEPIIPIIPPQPYNIGVRNSRTSRQNVHSTESLLNFSLLGSLRDSSTSDDSLDSISTTIRCAAPHRPSGYFSEGESLCTSNIALPELSVADVSNGYMSEGGITVYARKMQARFKEGLEAVRDSMRQRNHDFSDRFVHQFTYLINFKFQINSSTFLFYYCT